MNVLILANGDPPSAALAQRLAAAHDLIIATDGAAAHAIRLGITPDIICGDFDSIDMEAVRLALPHAEFIATPDQNAADLEKAIHLAQSRGATFVTITGAAGGRIDHTFANFSLLLRYSTELQLCIVDDRSQVWALASADTGTVCFTVSTQPDDTISLISLEPHARVSISGVEWELTDFPLSPGTRGVSNIALATQVTVKVHHGSILLCRLFSLIPNP